MSDRGREEATTDSPFTVTLPSGDAVSAMAYSAAGAPPVGTTVATQVLVGGQIAQLRGVTRRSEPTRVDGVWHIGVEFEPGQWPDVAILAEGLFREGVSTALVSA